MVHIYVETQVILIMLEKN